MPATTLPMVSGLIRDDGPRLTPPPTTTPCSRSSVRRASFCSAKHRTARTSFTANAHGLQNG